RPDLSCVDGGFEQGGARRDEALEVIGVQGLELSLILLQGARESVFGDEEGDESVHPDDECRRGRIMLRAERGAGDGERLDLMPVDGYGAICAGERVAVGGR